MIGDTVHPGAPLRLPDVPRFPPEHFGRARLKDTRYKQFDDGLRQLEEEGLMQTFVTAGGRREPIVAVVGALQFEVIASRRQTGDGVDVSIAAAPYAAARWLGDPTKPIPSMQGQGAIPEDRPGRRGPLVAPEGDGQD